MYWGPTIGQAMTLVWDHRKMRLQSHPQSFQLDWYLIPYSITTVLFYVITQKLILRPASLALLGMWQQCHLRFYLRPTKSKIYNFIKILVDSDASSTLRSIASPHYEHLYVNTQIFRCDCPKILQSKVPHPGVEGEGEKKAKHHCPDLLRFT